MQNLVGYDENNFAGLVVYVKSYYIMLMHNILVTSQFFNGKDSVSDFLINKINSPDWVKNHFAKEVKNIFMKTFEVDTNFIEKWKRIDVSPEGFDLPIRDCLIHIGDGFRKMKQNIWIDLALRNQKKNYIIADGRYTTEAKYIKDLGGFNVLLWRPGYENDVDSPSEKESLENVKLLIKYCDKCIPKQLNSNYDFLIVNDGTLEDLSYKVDNLLFPEIQKWLSK